MNTIDDFTLGQHATFTKTFTDDDVRRFVEITGDVNPLHVDDDFAARTRFGRRVIHGMLTASILSTMVGMFIPGTGAIYRSQSIAFLRPVWNKFGVAPGRSGRHVLIVLDHSMSMEHKGDGPTARTNSVST